MLGHMNVKRGAKIATLVAFGLVACVGLISSIRGASAAAPLGGTGQPAILDPYHHISGVVVVDPARVVREAAAGLGKGLAGPLALPIFGPNVDATLNNGAVQNETTIAINPEDDQRIIASANDYRCGLCPYVYLSTNGGANWTNYPVPGAGALNYGDPATAFGTGGHAYFG